MGETCRTYLHAIRFVRAIRDQVDSKLTFGMFYRRISLAFRHMHAFGKQLEVMDQLFHVLFHGFAIGRCELVVLYHHRPGVIAQPRNALTDDAI